VQRAAVLMRAVFSSSWAVFEEAAHALVYFIVTDRRFTDLFHWGNGASSVGLAAEIQRRLLPTAPSCQADRVRHRRRPGPHLRHRR
jgi:hypothetical protein